MRFSWCGTWSIFSEPFFTKQLRKSSTMSTFKDDVVCDFSAKRSFRLPGHQAVSWVLIWANNSNEMTTLDWLVRLPVPTHSSSCTCRVLSTMRPMVMHEPSRAGRMRCILAVLAEQARQDTSPSRGRYCNCFDSQEGPRMAVLAQDMHGILHQESSCSWE